MYVNEPDKAGSTPVARYSVPEEDHEALIATFRMRFGPEAAALDGDDLTSIHDARGGFLWTVLTCGGAPKAFFRQPAFAIRPKWTFVPAEEVPDDIISRFLA